MTHHTHSAITHPALRHRMAVALNQLRHEDAKNCEGLYKFSAQIKDWIVGQRRGIRHATERMALIEQELDTAQYVRVAGRLWQVE